METGDAGDRSSSASCSNSARTGGRLSGAKPTALAKRKTKMDLVDATYPKAIKVKHVETGNTGSQLAELCLVPCGYKLQPSKLLDLVKDTWRLELPNLIVAFDIGSAHPLQLGTTELAELPQFQQWLADARRHRSEVKRPGFGSSAAAAAAAATAEQ